MLFTNLTPVSCPRRFAGRFASFALAALLAGASAAAQNPDAAQTSKPAPAQSSNPAPGTAPMQQPSSSSGQSSSQSAPGTAPMKSRATATALAPSKGPSYENRWDLYGGFAFLNGQAGQNLPK